ncbi:DNA-binding domain-containing protein [Paenibacillus tritici]|jgi:two-component system, response regulator YcbB|uniref:DNA-binding domain-containing protein n=1 Tax=Paenibacillus tritici TaxID=1873425 RepID=A0ABX2DZ79_9BACL|nr:response regulator [Paenibacillus tritici]NQX49720.1 DNA-binding domain-containing protein [Paenibacillus tritici]QUL55633.1 response regulator [Paenibacillus tritici]
MPLSFCIVDDDASARRMLQHIIEDSGLGEVTGTAESGQEGIALILSETPDIVLMDLLMPDQDGIETILSLQAQGCRSKFVMISQIENGDVVSRAYRSGIEFFIRKPINKIEVESVLYKVNERYAMGRYLDEIKLTLGKLEGLQFGLPQVPSGKRTVREIVQPILMNMGMISESGSRDMITLMELAVDGAGENSGSLPPLKELYERAAAKNRPVPAEAAKEVKAIEQRLRRALAAGLSNLASIGLTDYGNPKFEHYAPLYFDFEEVRLKMKEMEQGRDTGKVKVNIRKFLQVLHLEVLEGLGR